MMLAQLSCYLNSNRKACLDVLRIAHSIGRSLNARGDRFAKAEMIDKAYCKLFSRLTYVDEIGYDFTYYNWKISQKSLAKAFRKKMPKTTKITIANIHESSDINYKLFDDLIITQTTPPYAIAITSYDGIQHLLKRNSAEIWVEIPFDKLNFIIHPQENIDFMDVATIDFKKYKNEMIEKMLSMALLTETSDLCLV